MSEKSFRKPYNPPIEATWWAKNPFYFRYMLREGTSFAATFAVFEILLGIFLFALSNQDAPIQTAKTAAPYLWWVQSFLGNPIVIVINIAVLAACLFHAVTWFSLMPKAVRVFMNKNSTDRLPDYVTIIGLYIAAAVGTVVVLGAAFLSLP